MTDPRRLAELDWRRAASGRTVRSVARPGKQPSQGPVTLEADLHLTVTSESETDGRQAFQAITSALLDRGFSVTVTGPNVVVEEKRPRGLTQ
jgi:hypothetical protein